MNTRSTLGQHWREYAIEGALLGLFMLSACGFSVLLKHPHSPVQQVIPDAAVRHVALGIAMGLTAIGIIYSPWGQRSGAHINPAITLAFLRLGKIKSPDAAFYIAAQFAGGVCGVLVAKLTLGQVIAHPTVNYAATVPGAAGPFVAFAAEAAISCGMMLVVLLATNSARLKSFTGIFAGMLVAAYITFEAPLSGMSMNPARTTASALPSGTWTALWIYFAAPLLGMFAAVEIFRAAKGLRQLACPKFHHGSTQPCIFCGHPGKAGRAVPARHLL